MKIYVDAYMANNLGDDLFIDILTNRYQNHKFYAISEYKDGYKNNNLKVFRNKYIFKILKKFQWEKYLANCFDIVVTIGGSMFMENNNSDRDFSLGKNKRYILGVNFGPYQSQEYYQNIHAMLSKVEDVCFRDTYSYNLFKDLTNTRVAPDIVFSMDTSKIEKTNRKRAIISIISPEYKLEEKYKKDYEKCMIKLIEFLIKKDYEICLMSFCKIEHDEEEIETIIEKIPEQYKSKIDKYYYYGNLEEALNLLADSQLIVGGRFHANIIGLLLGKSILPVIYSEKTLNVLQDMNINAPVIDIRKLQDFKIDFIQDEDLVRKYDVNEETKNAQEHFKNLDIVLGRKSNE